MGRLITIGVVAGVFSALFGVGGGIVIVPLLMLLAGFTAHRATAASIGAILLTATAGTVLYALRGEVHVGYAVLVGVPAMAGALLGTRIQAQLTGRALTLAFAALLVAIGGWLIVG